MTDTEEFDWETFDPEWGWWYKCMEETEEKFSGRQVISSFEIGPDWCTPTTNYAMYYTSPLHKSLDDYSADQLFDYNLCGDLNFIVKDFLSYLNKDFPKIRGYLGFESGGFCRTPSEYREYFNEPNERYNCNPFREKEKDTNSFYDHKCRSWYETQEADPDYGHLSDLYIDADGETLVATLCISLKHPVTGEFYAAICQDVNVFQTFVW